MSNSKKIAQTSIKKNYIYNTIYQVLSLITPLITAPYISRVLGSSGVGIYSYTNSIVTYFTLFAALGTASYGQREIAMHRNDSKASSKLFWEIEFLSNYNNSGFFNNLADLDLRINTVYSCLWRANIISFSGCL